MNFVLQCKDISPGSDNEGTSEYDYVVDEDFDGPAYPSQACQKHGISYTPPGCTKVLRKVDSE